MWQIVKDFLRVIKHIKKGGTVIFPADGIGTGIAELEKRAPQTYKFVQVMWDYCIWLGEDIETKRIQTAE